MKNLWPAWSGNSQQYWLAPVSCSLSIQYFWNHGIFSSQTSHVGALSCAGVSYSYKKFWLLFFWSRSHARFRSQREKNLTSCELNARQQLSAFVEYYSAWKKTGFFPFVLHFTLAPSSQTISQPLSSHIKLIFIHRPVCRSVYGPAGVLTQVEWAFCLHQFLKKEIQY